MRAHSAGEVDPADDEDVKQALLARIEVRTKREQVAADAVSGNGETP